jgi:uncharacterized Zn finger protein
MKQTNIDPLRSAIRYTWDVQADAKAKRYIGEFFDRALTGNRIVAKVEGNHGVYTVSINVKGKTVESACSCYIGAGGFCHHCDALAFTFLNEPESFKPTKRTTLKQVSRLDQLESYLKGKALDTLLQELKAQGIAQKEFAQSIGMNPRHLSSIKSSELRNRYYNELGAIKLACLWVMEHIKK